MRLQNAVSNAFLTVFLWVSGPALAEGRFSAKEALKQVDETIKAGSATPDFKAAVRLIRDAEKLIIAAVQTGDRLELTSQYTRLMRIQSGLMDGSDPGDQRRWACGGAAGDLAMMTSAMQRLARSSEPAKALVEAESAERRYHGSLSSCEREIRLAERRSRR